MRRSGLSLKEAHAHVRDLTIRTTIGRTLSTHYNLAEPLSDRLEQLLKRLEHADEFSAAVSQRPVAAPSQRGSCAPAMIE
jgi:hypothetical protein